MTNKDRAKRLTNSIKSEIKRRIKKGDLKMKPKAYFILGTVLSTAGTIVFSILGTFFANIVIHRANMTRASLEFRQAPISTRNMIFLKALPWEYLLLSIAFIVTGIYLLKKFDLSYKKSFTGLVILMVTLITLTAFAIDNSGLNERLKGKRYLKNLYQERQVQVKGAGIKRFPKADERNRPF